MRPYLLKGHSRPLTQLKCVSFRSLWLRNKAAASKSRQSRRWQKRLCLSPLFAHAHKLKSTFLIDDHTHRFNLEGDLLFSCGKDHNPNVWYTEDGRRLGNYVGHNGAVSTCDVSRDSELLLTGSADSSAKLWDVKSGECHATWGFDAPCKAVAFALGDEFAALSTDPFMSREPAIHLVSIDRADPSSSGKSSNGEEGGGATFLRKLTGFKGRTNRVAFTDGNACLLSAGEDGVLRRWDVETGRVKDEAEIAEGPLTDLQLSADGTHLAVSSFDTRARLVDAVSLEVLKTYQTGTNANGAAIHPTFPHVLVGGGQEASQVTTTSSRAGKFEARFFHKVYAEEIGHVRGHFGPINAVAFAPDGRSFATGGEDGYVRLHHFDSDYFKLGSRES